MPSLLNCHIPEQAWLKEAGQRNGSSTAPARLQDGNGNQKVVANAGSWEPAVQTIVDMEHLGDDWDGQGARAPSHEMLVSAIGLAYTLLHNGMDPPTSVVPGLEGSVIFEWQPPDGTFCEVEIVRPFHAEVMLVEPGKPAQHWTLPTE